MSRDRRAIAIAGAIGIGVLVVVLVRSRDASDDGRARAEEREVRIDGQSVRDGDTEGDESARRSDVAAPPMVPFFVADGGTPTDLGLIGEAPNPGAVAIPARERLVVAEQATERFATALSRVEAERARQVGEGATDVTRLDAQDAFFRKRLAIAELAERAIRAEVAASAEPPPRRGED